MGRQAISRMERCVALLRYPRYPSMGVRFGYVAILALSVSVAGALPQHDLGSSLDPTAVQLSTEGGGVGGSLPGQQKACPANIGKTAASVKASMANHGQGEKKDQVLGDTNVAPASPYCTNGFAHPKGDTCCKKSCGACGGSGCSKRPGGAKNCCTNKIKAAKKLCKKNGADAPCIIPPPSPTPPPTPPPPPCPAGMVQWNEPNVAPASPYCTNGFANPKGDTCCKKSCGDCGGSGCSKRPGGSNNCCTNKIQAAKKLCKKKGADAPYIIPPSPPPPPPTSRCLEASSIKSQDVSKGDCPECVLKASSLKVTQESCQRHETELEPKVGDSKKKMAVRVLESLNCTKTAITLPHKVTVFEELPSSAAVEQLGELGAGAPKKSCKWIGASAGDDNWCNNNCNHVPAFCPPTSCNCNVKPPQAKQEAQKAPKEAKQEVATKPWSIQIEFSCEMKKELFCSPGETNPAAKFVQAFANDTIPITCRRTSSITPIYGKSSITSEGGCPMDFETAFAYAKASAPSTNLISIRDAKGKAYCQNFATQF